MSKRGFKTIKFHFNPKLTLKTQKLKLMGLKGVILKKTTRVSSSKKKLLKNLAITRKYRIITSLSTNRVRRIRIATNCSSLGLRAYTWNHLVL
mgnify:CR=1 FL=1